MKQQAKVLTLLLVSSLVRPAYISTAAGQSCLLSCMDASAGISGMTYQHKYELCEIRCKGQADPPAYGAIAYSRKDKLWGFTYNQSDKATAEKLAFQNCVKQGGAKCLIEASFHNICGAIAADGDTVAWGTSGTKLNAEQNALAACARAGGKKCAAQASICSSPGAGGGSSLPSTSLPGTPLAPRTASWGAIAYSNGDMGAGFSQGKDDRASAEKEAMAACSQRGKACVLRTAFNKQCGALAADRDFAGWGTSADQREAQQTALDACKRAGGARCVLHISFCSN
jgi:hypothetical protein